MPNPQAPNDPTAEIVRFDGATPEITENEDGTTTVDFDPVDAEPEPGAGGVSDHGANLALFLTEDQLSTIATELLEEIDGDRQADSEADERLAKAIKLLGVPEDAGVGPFDGASRVVHPGLGEACVQFWARTVGETWPPAGPVKAAIAGDPTEELEDQRRRVEMRMNHAYTREMPEAFSEHSELVFRLGFEGCAYKKVYPDPRLGRLSVRYVRSENIIIPYSALSLRTSRRVTEVLPAMTETEVKRSQESGVYRTYELSADGTGGDEEDTSRVVETIDRAEGMSAADGDMDKTWRFFESHTEWSIPGIDDGDDGLDLPYIITIDRDKNTILSIYRNWREDDALRQARRYYVEYVYLPSLSGRRGYGLLHWIGGLSAAMTGSLRALLDSAQFSNMQGGFKSKDARSEAGSKPISPGEWRDTDMTSAELAKAFVPLNYKEPSVVMFQLLGFLQTATQRFAGTMEPMVGDAANTGPVGTTVALIEQGTKVFSAIHRNVHIAQSEEFEIVAEWIKDLTPDGEGYSFHIAGDESHVVKDDFDGRVDIIPVADPNIYSDTQRIALAQSGLQMAMAPGSFIDRRKAEERMLKALKIPDPDGLMKPELGPDRMDALTENMAMLYGEPIKVYGDQDHKAHMVIHVKALQALPPEMQKNGHAVVMAHVAQHIAWEHRLQVEDVLSKEAGQNVTLPPPPDFGVPADKRKQAKVPPEQERMIDAMVAQAAQVLSKQSQGQGQKQPDPQQQKAAADMQMGAAKFEQEQQQEQQSWERDEQRKNAEWVAEQRRKEAQGGLDAMLNGFGGLG